MGYDRTEDKGFRTDVELAKFKHPPEVIEKALFTLAAFGGSCSKAHVALKDEGIEVSQHTLKEWKRGPFRNKYTEIATKHVKELDEIIAASQTENVLALVDAERAAIKQTMAGLANANGKEAADILRSIAQAKRMGVQNVGEIQNKPHKAKQAQSLDVIARSLARLGLMEDPEPIEAEVVED